jgi:A/G-specific adenine glycosylase
MTEPRLTRRDKLRITRTRTVLLGWFAENGRDLPWRAAGASTYEKICVEVLLQRTRAETVAGIYSSFFTRFSGWTEIAQADRAELEEHLKPIGLWKRRAVSIQGLARYAEAHCGIFPADAREHADIPGVGQYVSNAILLFQHGKARPLLDVNMARVLERVVRPRVLADIRFDPWLQEAAAWLVNGDRPELVNWAVLDYAAAVCKARSPCCDRCQIRQSCPWSRRNRAKQG